jgi:hypothetical protein
MQKTKNNGLFIFNGFLLLTDTLSYNLSNIIIFISNKLYHNLFFTIVNLYCKFYIVKKSIQSIHLFKNQKISLGGINQ